jgi:hypothetical protein
MITNLFSFTLDYTNAYTYEVNTLFTDEYCIIKEPITSLKIEVYDAGGALESRMVSYEDIYQLNYKQTFYKYYQHDETASELVLQIDDTNLVDGYLDNQLRNLIIDADEIIDPLTREEIPFILRLPYLEMTYFQKDWTEMYQNLESFFQLKEAEGKIQFNTRVIQSFYDTITIPDKYSQEVFRVNNNFNKTNPQLNIAINIYLDKEAFHIDTTYSTYDDLVFSLKLDIIEFFKESQGFQIKYFESELEAYIYAKYNTNSSGIQYLKNIEIISPKMFIVNDSDSIFYNIKNNKDLTFDDLVNFIPPFFHFDLDNINLQIKF